MPSEVARFHCEEQATGLIALRPPADRRGGRGDRAEDPGAPRVQDPQCASLGGCDAVRHRRAALRARRTARGHDTCRIRWHRRSELRRIPRARHQLRAAGSNQRLCRQGLVGRPDRRLSGSRVSGEARREHRHRQYGDVRRDCRRGVFSRHRRRALLRAQFRRLGRRRGHRRSWLRVHDRRDRRRARAHRSQFRRR